MGAEILPPPPAPLDIRRAAQEDKAKVLGIYMECAQWLKSKGLDQWNQYLGEEGPGIVERRFREGEVYLASLENQEAAAVVLQWQDAFWGERGSDPRAGYLHGIALRRAFAGRELGKALLLWSLETARLRGKSLFRLDCVASNPKMISYYRSLGFHKAGVIEWKNMFIQLFEREL